MDARHFFSLAVERGFVAPASLIGAEATRAAVRSKIGEMAALSEPGDLFLLTFSGHGGEDGSWQLYDGKLNDEMLMADLSLFRQGVRVLVVADGCGGGLPRSPQSPAGSERSVAARLRGAAPLGTSLSRPATEGFLKASVLVLAACEQGKHADGEGLPGHFAAALNRTLNGFAGPYNAFHKALIVEMPPYQKPDFYRLGPRNPAFEAQHPFTI